MQWTVGLLGYGEVGRILAEELRERGIAAAMHDVKLADSEGAALAAHARDHGVAVAGDASQLARQADLVISAVTASQAVAAAAAASAGLRPGAFFLDLNSASPGSKRTAAVLVEAAAGRYVEAAVMAPVPPYRLRVPLLLGGPHAAALLPLLERAGFAPTPVSAELGVASAVKMCRSVVVKGMEALLIESFSAARAYGVEDAVVASLQESFPGIDWERQGTYFFQRVIEHGRRRAEEMREVAHTVAEAGLAPWSAEGTAARQDWVAGLAAAGVFGTGAALLPQDWRLAADRILQARSSTGLPPSRE